MQQLFSNIRGWAAARNILSDSTEEDQFIKGLSEFGELAKHVGKNELSKLKDDIGDILVCLTNALAVKGIDIEDHVWIHDRWDGVMFEGVDAKIASLHRDLKRNTRLLHRQLTEFDLLFVEEVSVVEDANSSEFSKERFQSDSIVNLCSIFDTLENIAMGQGWTLKQCLEAAWNDIKDRKGLMCKGTFIKEADFTPDYVRDLLANGELSESGITYLNEWLKENV